MKISLLMEEQRSKLSRAGLDQHFSISPNISREEKLEFLKNLTVFSVPARYPEAFGLYVVEAMLAGTPVVLPASGAFPEIIDSTKEANFTTLQSRKINRDFGRYVIRSASCQGYWYTGT